MPEEKISIAVDSNEEPINVAEVSKQTSQTSKKKFSKRIIVFGIISILVIIFVVGMIQYIKKPQKQVKLDSQNQTVQSTPGPNDSINTIVKKEDLGAINGEFKLTYFFRSPESDNLILKIADFKSKTFKETQIPIVDKYEAYRISPSGKYLARITNKKLEIADLSSTTNLVFKNIHEVPVMMGDPQNYTKDYDFARIGDVIWDDKSRLYFLTTVGNDAMENPYGVYSDLYVADEDGSNKKLINDHKKENQNYGFMKTFDSVNTNLNEIYYSGTSHGGHATPLIVVDSNTGEFKRSLGNPGFLNSNFTKLYYPADKQGETGDIDPFQIIEQEIKTGIKKQKYALSGSYIYLYQYPIFFSKSNDKFYFPVSNGKDTSILMLDIKTEEKPKVILDKENGNCQILAVSENDDILFVKCSGVDSKATEYKFYQISKKLMTNFYTEKITNPNEYRGDTIQMLSFN